MIDAMALADRLENFAEDLTSTAMNARDTRRIKLLESAAKTLRALRATAQPAVTTGAEAVAWQTRCMYDKRSARENEWCDWRDCTEKWFNKTNEYIAAGAQRIQARALYAALPAANTAGDVREAAATLVESCHDFKVTSSIQGPDATPEALATAACRWLTASLAEQIRAMPLSTPTPVPAVNQPAPEFSPPQNTVERLPSSDATEEGFVRGWSLKGKAVKRKSKWLI